MTPKMLIMDQKVTTQAILGELDGSSSKFAALRMRSASLMKHINGLAGKDYKAITLDRPGPYNRPRVHEDPAVTLTSYPGAVRQLVVTGLGRDAPTVIITNDNQIKTRALISQYARRMTIEQRLAEIIQAFCLGHLLLHDQPQCRPRRRALRPGPGPARCIPEPARPWLRHRHPRHHPKTLPRHPRNHHHRR